MKRLRIFIMLLFSMTLLAGSSVLNACGGLFCQNVPVDQQAERIIFTVNGDGTITAYVQINYVGEAPDFSWVVPVPSTPEIDVAEIESFDELSSLTAPIISSPPIPDDCPLPVPAMAMADDTVETAGGVDVLASGAVGPYNYDVITSPDPDAMVEWLRENSYRVTPEMEPLIKVYNDEGMVFLAMKLQPDQGADEIQPVVMTYESKQPMIPIRLTAVAAMPDMTVLTWVFADAQTVPENYASPVIADEDLRGNFGFGGNNYVQLLDSTADEYEGLAFITEYAQPTTVFRDLQPTDPLLRLLSEKYRYVTRHIGRISPEEMVLDPVFRITGEDDMIEDVSNIRDLSEVDARIYWGCPDIETQD